MKFDKNLCLFCKSNLKIKSSTTATCKNCSFNYSFSQSDDLTFHDFETGEFIITRFNI